MITFYDNLFWQYFSEELNLACLMLLWLAFFVISPYEDKAPFWILFGFLRKSSARYKFININLKFNTLVRIFLFAFW